MRVLLFTVAAVASSIGLVTDLRRRRIPNWLTASAFVFGVLAGFWLGGLEGGATALAGAGLGFLMLIPFYAIRAMGAGDVKLLAALGAILGPQNLITAAVYGAMVGGVMSMIVLVRTGTLAVALHQMLVMRTLPTVSSGVKTPYAVAIASGVYLAMVLPPLVR